MISMKQTTLSTIERRRRTALQKLADEIKVAQHKVDLLRMRRDGLLSEWHEDGSSVELLANAAGLTRQGVYDALRRVREQQDIAEARA